MTLTCDNGVGPQSIFFARGEYEPESIDPRLFDAPYEGPALGEFVYCTAKGETPVLSHLKGHEANGLYLPEPSGGLLVGVLLLAVLARRKR